MTENCVWRTCAHHPDVNNCRPQTKINRKSSESRRTIICFCDLTTEVTESHSLHTYLHFLLFKQKGNHRRMAFMFFFLLALVVAPCLDLGLGSRNSEVFHYSSQNFSGPECVVWCVVYVYVGEEWKNSKFEQKCAKYERRTFASLIGGESDIQFVFCARPGSSYSLRTRASIFRQYYLINSLSILISLRHWRANGSPHFSIPMPWSDDVLLHVRCCVIATRRKLHFRLMKVKANEIFSQFELEELASSEELVCCRSNSDSIDEEME